MTESDKCPAETVAAALAEMSFWLELGADNPFKVRAYQNAAQLVLEGAGNFPLFVKLASAGQIKGIGAELARQIATLHDSGNLPELDQLRASFPSGLREIAKIPGLGPKKVKLLYEELRVNSLEELEKACLEDKVSALKGFGAKSQQRIIAGLRQLKTYAGRFLLSRGLSEAEAVCEFLREKGCVERVEIAGSIRRHMEVVRNINLASLGNDLDSIVSALVEYPKSEEVLKHDNDIVQMRLSDGLAVELHMARSQSDFTLLYRYLTGSQEHNRELEALAGKKGFVLEAQRLLKEGQEISVREEHEIFDVLSLNYIPPELREAQGELEKAQHQGLTLLEAGELIGILHVHTTYSDGRHTLREMARAAQDLGYQYIGVSDHSRSAVYAGGLEVEAVKEQHAEIEALNKELAPFRIFKGIESDILADGSLDYPGEVLRSFDFVIASVHSYMNMSEEEMTGRLIRVLKNPYVTILGHPTGRLLLEREGYAVNEKALLETAALEGAAIELNANPHRLDLDWRHLPKAQGLGVKIAIGPDAHSIERLQDMHYGVGMARKGGLSKADVINCLSAKEFEAWLQARRAKRE